MPTFEEQIKWIIRDIHQYVDNVCPPVTMIVFPSKEEVIKFSEKRFAPLLEER